MDESLSPAATVSNSLKSQTPLRAIIEIDGGELRIFPVANCEFDEIAIVDALRFIREDFRQ